MRRMGIGLGIGINRSNYAQGIFSAYQSRVTADGGVTEAGACVDAVSGLLQTASLLLIPSGYKSGKAYAEIPTNGNGDLTWTRASTALRTNSSGLLESMGSGVPRLSYMYGSCPALLLEPQRTNLCLYSQDFDNAWWSKLNATITANSTTAPDGTTTADTLDDGTSSSTFHRVLGTSLTITAGSTYSYSIYVKKNTMRYVRIVLNEVSDTFKWFAAQFDLDNATATTGVGSTAGSTVVSSSITSVGNGWYRCTLVGSMTITTSAFPIIYASDGTAIASGDSRGSVSYTGTNKQLYLWGAQLELGAYATTIIPTTTASATRIADSFSRNNIYTNGLITSSGGTWFVELRGNISYLRDGTTESLFLYEDANNGLVIRPVGGGSRMIIYKKQAGTLTGLYTLITDTVKIAIKWNGSTADVFVNGTKQVSGTAFVTTLMETLDAKGSVVPLFIQAMGLHPTPLTDAQCIELTTL